MGDEEQHSSTGAPRIHVQAARAEREERQHPGGRFQELLLLLEGEHERQLQEVAAAAGEAGPAAWCSWQGTSSRCLCAGSSPGGGLRLPAAAGPAGSARCSAAAAAGSPGGGGGAGRRCEDWHATAGAPHVEGEEESHTAAKSKGHTDELRPASLDEELHLTLPRGALQPCAQVPADWDLTSPVHIDAATMRTQQSEVTTPRSSQLRAARAALGSAGTLGSGKCEAFVMKETWSVPGTGVSHMTAASLLSASSLGPQEQSQRLKSMPRARASLSGLQASHAACYSRPTSPFRLLWNGLGVTAIMYDLVNLPLMLFDPEPTDFTSGLRIAMMIFWALDMPASFTTGYFDKSGSLEMRPCRIAIHYCRTWFPIDASVVMSDWIVFFLEHGNVSTQGISQIGRTLRSVRFLNVIRLLRLIKLQLFMDSFQDLLASGNASVHMNIVKIVLFLLIINHFIACCWYGVGAMDSTGWVSQTGIQDDALWDRYVKSYYWSLAQFGVGNVDFGPGGTTEYSFGIAVLLFALVTASSLVSSITNAMSTIRNLRSQQTVQFARVRKYLRENAVSRDLSKRIRKHVEFSFGTRHRRLAQSDVELFRYLSEPLRNELQLEIFARCFQDHSLFRKLCKVSLFTVQKVCGGALRTLCIACEDQLFCTGEEAKSAYVVREGGAIYVRRQRDGNALKHYHVKEQKWVAEATLWTHWVHLGEFTAITECELIAVDPGSFAELVRLSSVAFYMTQAYCVQFIQRLNELATSQDEDVLDIDQDFVQLTSAGSARWASETENDMLSGVAEDIPVVGRLRSWAQRILG